MALRIYDTLRRAKVEFVPLTPGRVSMYVCGITSYAPSHIGHARAFVAFDVVHRWLRRSYEVTFVRNYTDIDDKIIKAAKESGQDPVALSAHFVERCDREVKKLGCIPP